jgi:hypothetical protein
MVQDMPVRVPQEFRRGRLRDFYLDGHVAGLEVGREWTRGSAAEETEEELRENPYIGEMIGEWLSSYAQYADTIYYESGVTDRQLEAWEAGVQEGIVDIIEPWAGERDIELL